MMLTIGIDVGGTFTDLVTIDRAGRRLLPRRFDACGPIHRRDGRARRAGRRLGMTRAAMLAATHRIIHGTTVATKALLERKGARVALLTTEGHRDVIEMREGLKGNRYDLRTPPPEPLVPRELRFGIHERLRPNGEVLTPLDHESLDRAIETVRNSGVTSVAVCYLHAYRDPAHEIAAVERIGREFARTLRLAIERRAAPDQGIRARLDNRRERLCRADGSAVLE